MLSAAVKNIIQNYQGEAPGVLTNLARILMAGKLGGSGKILVLPVDQGFEHGPLRSFAVNSASYDPLYHFDLAVTAGVSAYAAPLGMLEAGVSSYLNSVPLILKLNSSNSLQPTDSSPNQATTASVADAVRLGCCAVGFTIYPGSHNALDLIEEASSIIAEAKSLGLPTVIWSYPRGGDLGKKGEVALDVISYAAHIACLIGAHIVKVKLPEAHLHSQESDSGLVHQGINIASLSDRVSLVCKASLAGRRMVLFSGGQTKNNELLLDEVRAIAKGGAHGSIIGRNAFQRPRAEALSLLESIINVYQTC